KPIVAPQTTANRTNIHGRIKLNGVRRSEIEAVILIEVLCDFILSRESSRCPSGSRTRLSAGLSTFQIIPAFDKKRLKVGAPIIGVRPLVFLPATVAETQCNFT